MLIKISPFHSSLIKSFFLENCRDSRMTKIISKYTYYDDCPITNCIKKTIWIIKYEPEGMVRYIYLGKELNTVTIVFPGMPEINTSNFSLVTR